jgi:hypothetical protein
MQLIQIIIYKNKIQIQQLIAFKIQIQLAIAYKIQILNHKLIHRLI